MKKTLALILAIVMMAALAVPAFAETPVDEGVLSSETLVGEGTKGCTVTYGVAQSYTVSLPTAINFAYAENEQTATLIVNNFVINGSNKLVITMDSAFDTTTVGGWEMRDVAGGSTAVPYNVEVTGKTGDNVETTVGDVTNADTANSAAPSVVMEVNSNVDGEAGSVTLMFTTEGTKQAGDYSDQITFAVSIVEA